MRSLVLLAVFASTAHADEAVGHFPLLSAGAIAGFDSSPVPFTSAEGTADSLSSMNGVVGPDVTLELDTHHGLIEVEGMYSPVGDLRWAGRAQLTLGHRSTHEVVYSIHDSAPDSSGYVTRTTTYVAGRYLPIYYGFTGGVAAWGFDTSSAGEIDVHMRDAATAVVANAGLTIRSPQIELTVAPQIEVTRGNFGLHWALGMAFPVAGNGRPLFFRFSGDHLFGDDPVDNSGRRTAMIFLFSIGVGSSLGIGPIGA